MRHSACLWFALTVLFAALACGNPFLPCGGNAAGKAVQGVPLQARPAALDSGREPAFALARGGQSDAGFVLTGGRAVDAAVAPVSLRATLPAGDEPEACPDPELAPWVVGVERIAGESVWVLRDGRRMRRSRVAGQPTLVPVSELDK